MYKYYQKLLVFRQNTFGIKFITMKDLEFYIFENLIIRLCTCYIRNY